MNKILNNKNIFSFGIKKAVFYSIIAVFTMQLVGGIIQIPAFFYPSFNSLFLPLGFFLGITTAIGLLFSLLNTSTSTIIKDIKNKFSIKELILVIFIWITFLPLCEFLTTLIPTTGFLEGLFQYFQANLEILINYKIAGFIMVCILAPIFEEILFRGIILKGMLNNKLNPATAIIVSGIIFGTAHLNPWQFVGAGLLGSIFGFVYYRTKSLLLPIILHALNNTLSYFFLINYESTTENVFDISNFYLIGSFSITALVLCYILYKITNKQNI